MAWPLQDTVGLLRSYQSFLSFPYAIRPSHYLYYRKKSVAQKQSSFMSEWLALLA